MNKFRLSKISLINYKLFEKREIDFGKANLVVLDGPNGYGKTSIFEAIEYLLTGDIKRATQCPEVSGSLSYDTHFLARDNTKNVLVSGQFVSEQSILKIERCIYVENISGIQNNPKNLKSVTQTKIWFEDEMVYDDSAIGADEIIENYLGNTLLEYYDSFYYVSQEDRLKFLMAPESKRMEQISSLFNIDDEIREYTKYTSFKKKLSQKVKKLQKENKEERKAYEKYKQNIQETDANKREYQDIFINNEKKPYWNERVVHIKEKEKLNDILQELKRVSILSRNVELFQVSLDNVKFDSYVKNVEQLKKILVFNVLKKDIDNKKKQYSVFDYLSSLPVKDGGEEIDVEGIDYKELNDNLEINAEIDTIVQLQKEILQSRKKQSTYNESLERLQNARDNLTKSLNQWRTNGGEKLGGTVCPYCGYEYDAEIEYDSAVADVAKTLEECCDSELDKIKQNVRELQREYDDKFKKSINEFLNQHIYMRNEIIKSIITDTPVFVEEYNKFMTLLKKQKLNLEEFNVVLDDENDWEVKAQQLVKLIQGNCIRTLSDEYIQMQNENRFFEVFESVFDNKIESIAYISDEDENAKRLYLEEQYQLQEHEKLKNMEECLLQKEKVAQELENMKNEIEKVVTIYKDEIGKYQKKIIGEIQIPLYIYSGRVLQYYQGGLGIFVKYDTKGEKLDAIRLLSSNQPDHDILYTLSSGQLTGIIISLTLTLNKIYGTEKFSCILIDDPVQTMDDLNIASLVELLRNEFKDYQMIMSTHEEDFSRFIRYKYEKYNLVAKRYKLNEMG